MYYCLNVSCEPEGRAGGVLFRALEPICGLEAMAAARGLPATRVAALTSGPGRLCQAFGITRARDNGVDLTSPDSDLQIQDDGFVARKTVGHAPNRDQQGRGSPGPLPAGRQPLCFQTLDGDFN